ncbi:hypothetical protein D9M71_553240 [compost metagenome]
MAPAAIGLLASHVSIGAGFLVMGITYVITGLVPALMIPNRLYDPNREARSPQADAAPAAPARPAVQGVARPTSQPATEESVR